MSEDTISYLILKPVNIVNFHHGKRDTPTHINFMIYYQIRKGFGIKDLIFELGKIP